MTGISQNAVNIALELAEILKTVDETALDALEDEILKAGRIFFSGAGRSMLMLKAFAMRLMQTGYTVYVKGEVVTPAIRAGDLLIIGSGSGETSAMTLDAKKAKSVGARLALITTNPSSTIGVLADLTVDVDVETAKYPGREARKSIQPGGSAFEQALMLMGDAVMMRLMEKNPQNVMALHANLE